LHFFVGVWSDSTVLVRGISAQWPYIVRSLRASTFAVRRIGGSSPMRYLTQELVHPACAADKSRRPQN
jgi:hypothetical protein